MVFLSIQFCLYIYTSKDVCTFFGFFRFVFKVTNVTMKHYKVYYCTKRSRARVTIGGQCVLLQNSLKIKMNHIFPGILMNP